MFKCSNDRNRQNLPFRRFCLCHSIIRIFGFDSSFVIRISSFILFLLALSPCHAQTVELTHHDAPRPGQWELLTVTFDPTVQAAISPATISVQDARGGLTISRPTTSATITSTGKAQLLIPLPYLAETDLPSAKWPVHVLLQSANQRWTSGFINVARPVPRSPMSTLVPAQQWPKQEWNLAPPSASTLRIMVPANSDLRIPPYLAWRPITSTAIPDQEILSGPILLFASTDMLLLSPDLASKISQDRAAALMSTGLKLIIADNAARPVPAGSPLSRFPWVRLVPNPDSAAWITPPPTQSPLPRLQVLEPHLLDTTLILQPAASKRITIILYSLPFVAILILLLARGLFRRPAILLPVLALTFAALSLFAFFFIPTASPPTTAHAVWSTTSLPADQSSSLVLSESFTATASLFNYTLNTTAEQTAALFPVFATPREFFLQDARLTLDVPAPNTLDRLSRLEASLPPRSCLICTTRTATLARLQPSSIHTLSLAEGYISQDSTQTKTLLTQWAAAHLDLAPALLTAFNLGRLPIDRTYLLQLPSDSSPLTFLEPAPSAPNAP